MATTLKLRDVWCFASSEVGLALHWAHSHITGESPLGSDGHVYRC